MKIKRVKDKGLLLSRLPAGQVRLLKLIPMHADPSGLPAAAEKLFQDAVHSPQDDQDYQANVDWREHVVPDLEQQFAQQLDVVTEDLKNVRKSGGTAPGSENFEFLIPYEHVDDWYGALNQARLVMQERHHFPELDSTEALMKLLQSDDLRPYLTARFYIEIQSALLDLAMDK